MRRSIPSIPSIPARYSRSDARFFRVAAVDILRLAHGAEGYGVAVGFVLDLRGYGAEKKQNSLKKDLHFAKDMVI